MNLEDSPRARRRANWMLALVLGFSPVVSALAAQPPSTGTLLKQTTPPPALPTAPGPVITLPTPKAQRSRAAIRIPVREVRIEGNHLIPTAALKPLVAGVEGRTVTLGELDAAAARITALYHARGYPLAYAYLPAQSVRNGVVTVKVIEPRYDRIVVQGTSRLSPAQARRILAVRSGEPIAQAPLNRGLLLLDRTPGIRVQGTLIPGAKPATSTLQVNLSGEPLVQGGVSVDNYGNDYTGRTRWSVDASVANPFGYGSELALNALTTSGGLLHAGGFTLLSPDLWRGLRGGVYGSRTIYHLGGTFKSLGQSGRATQIGVDLSAPVILQPGRVLSVRLDLLRNGFEQHSATANTDERSHISEARVSVDGADAGWGGVTSGGISLTRGVLTLDSADALTADVAGPNARGPFWVGQLRLARTQSLPQQLRLQATISGQWASRNLDGSEKFYLGGPYGVMSYPVGEASGDEGLLLRMGLSHGVPLPVPGHLRATALLQGGVVWVNRDPYAGFNAANREHLAGAGVGLDYQWGGWVAARVSYVHQLGGTRATAGPDHSGELWASLRVNL